MSSFIKFTPITGAMDEQPLCYLLQIDQASILLDCGMHSIDSLDALEPLRKLQIDAVLLSHGDLEHMGGLVYAVKHLLLSPNSSTPSVTNAPPIYATLPIANLGRLTAMDHWSGVRLHQELPQYDLADIEAVFESVKSVKYSESISLSGRAQGITLIPVAAGHTVGGTVWRIKKDTDEIVYAVSYNHKKERHLEGTALDGIYRPSLLITDSYNATVTQPTRKQRDADLIDTMLKTLQKDGNVLMPVDSTTRILELIYLLDQLWAYHQLNFPLLLLAPFAQKTVDYAKSMLEWMGESITKVFATSRETPFDFKFLKICQTIRETEAYPNPKVILATLPTVENGVSRDLFFAFCDRPQNLILLTGRSFPGTLARYLYEISEGKAEKPGKLALTMRKRIPLEGEELAQHLRKVKELEEKREAELALQQEKQRMLEEEDESEDDMDLISGHGYHLFHGERFDYFNSTRQDQSSLTRMNFFANDTRVAMFPCVEKRPRIDDYGVAIDLSMFEKLEIEQRQRYESTVAQPMETEETAKKEREQPTEVPSKYVSFDVRVDFRVQTKYIDFEGLSDGKSVKNILQQIAPKKLILIHGDEENTENLKQFLLESSSITSDLFTPKIGESINVSAATNLYQIKLTDALVSSLKFAKYHDYEIAFLSGKVSYQPSAVGSAEKSELSSLDQLPLADRWHAHSSMIIGDLKLTELRRALAGKGITADFEKGSLVIGKDRSIRVQRTREGDLMVEGPFSKDFYKVRKLIYRMHALC